MAAEAFKNNGFEVIDYSTSVSMFNSSGLPVVDTKSSRDKYAEFSSKTGVDIIVIPYYGTFSTASSAIIFTKMTWQSVVTYQFYLADQDIFISRIDASGTEMYTSGLLSMWGIGVSFLQPAIGGCLAFGGFAIDLINTVIKTNDEHWEIAFKNGINEGLEPFFATLDSYSTVESENKNFPVNRSTR